MKKIYLFACATLLALSGCTNEISEDGFVDKTNAISFSAYPTKTRAVTGDVTNANITDDNFGVVGYYSNKLYLGTATKATEQYWDGDSWEYKTPTELRFWPNGNMDFYAFFPYTSTNTTFASKNDGTEDPVMTFQTEDDKDQDMLFAVAKNEAKKDRLPLTFRHAFSKIESVTIKIADGSNVENGNINVEVKKVEFTNTSTKGTINVSADGVASYTVAATNTTRAFDLSSDLKKISSSAKEATLVAKLNKNGYLFATNTGTAQNQVIGTGKSLWDGTAPSASGTVEGNGSVSLKLTCKVWRSDNGTDIVTYYLGDDSNYADMYIPLKGKVGDTENILDALIAGKKYNFTIVMQNNVGYKNNGEPILTPILFKVNQVVDWEEVNVTITL